MPSPDASARLAEHRAQLALLDTTLICACERAAARGRHARLAQTDPARWNRSTWRRYLAEARAQDFMLGSRMRQLRSEIIALEQLDQFGRRWPKTMPAPVLVPACR